MGHTVEWFSATFPGAPNEEDMDGVHVVRAGRQWSVHWKAFIRYRGTAKHRFDAVIDEVNTVPFFTPLWAGIPTFMMMMQLAREVWWYESSFPLSAIGYLVEPIYLRFYRNVPVFTISKSTETDLRRLHFRGPINVIPIGIEAVSTTHEAKAETPTFLYVGRLAPSKRIGHLLHALAQFRSDFGSGVLWLVGSGSDRYRRSLLKLARDLGIEDSVTFWGRVPALDKHRLMSHAHCLLMASVREGWGLVVTEANACGTPAVVYDVPGLRDAVRDEATGLVVPPGPANLARAMFRLIADPVLYDRLSLEAQIWSRTFTFDRAALEVAGCLEGSLAA
jgi:glycosyltransferase involved in cell wall biosynthesis